MRFANVAGRIHLVTAEGAGIDLGAATDGAVAADPHDALQDWDAVLDRAASVDRAAAVPLTGFGPPSPRPRQAFAIGLNYAPHAAESGFQVPTHPFVFTKLDSSLAGPEGELRISSDTVDWEVEIVVVVGRHARHVEADKAWSHVAGLTVGQDFSDRGVQNRLGPNSQPTLGKSAPGFGPTGPYLVTPDEYDDPDDVELACTINGRDVQRGRSSGLIFGVPALVAYLSGVTDLYPGDLIFTGTPAGVGIGRTPPVFLKPGDVVETTVARAGTMRHTVTTGA